MAQADSERWELCFRCGGTYPQGAVCATCGAAPGWFERRVWDAAESACTPRCHKATVHSLDCPRYSGPLSKTGRLGEPEGPEATW